MKNLSNWLNEKSAILEKFNSNRDVAQLNEIKLLQQAIESDKTHLSAYINKRIRVLTTNLMDSENVAENALVLSRLDILHQADNRLESEIYQAKSN